LQCRHGSSRAIAAGRTSHLRWRSDYGQAVPPMASELLNPSCALSSGVRPSPKTAHNGGKQKRFAEHLLCWSPAVQGISFTVRSFIPALGADACSESSRTTTSRLTGAPW
jgi:hypothetical protein